MFFALTIQLAKLTQFIRFRKFNLVTLRLRLKIVMFYPRKHILRWFWIFKKSSTFASGKCGEICLLATTLKNAKNFILCFWCRSTYSAYVGVFLFSPGAPEYSVTP